MAQFTQNEIDGFRLAIKEVTDLFFGLIAIYHLRTESNDLWEEDSFNRLDTTISLPVLQVFKSDDKGKVEVKKEGVSDMSEGYLLFNYEDCEEANLIDENGNFKGNTAFDYVVVQGIHFQITGINLLGQFVDKSSIVKIQIKKKMQIDGDV